MSNTKEPIKCFRCNKLSDYNFIKNTCDWCGKEFIDIEWDFVMWEEKRLNIAQLKGVDDYGNEYFGMGNWIDGKLIYPAEDIEQTKNKQNEKKRIQQL